MTIYNDLNDFLTNHATEEEAAAFETELMEPTIGIALDIERPRELFYQLWHDEGYATKAPPGATCTVEVCAECQGLLLHHPFSKPGSYRLFAYCETCDMATEIKTVTDSPNDQQTDRASAGLISLIARAYAAGQLTGAEAADLHRQHAPGDDGLPECEHGVRCAVLMDGWPYCVLCRVEQRGAAA